MFGSGDMTLVVSQPLLILMALGVLLIFFRAAFARGSPDCIILARVGGGYHQL
jgi:hypothetical protein